MDATRTKTLLTTAEAAELLGVSRQHVVGLIRDGWLPAVRFGPVWQLREVDVRRYRRQPLGRRPKSAAK